MRNSVVERLETRRAVGEAMKSLCVLVLLVLAPVASMAGQAVEAAKQTAIAITHVTVIDTTGGPASSDMTVVVTGDRISEVGNTGKVAVPPGAKVLDGTGKFLIPGLWDMHVHWYDSTHVPLFIANGVTGIRVMWGSPLHHQWRQDIAAGTLTGPRMVIASSILGGPKPIWPNSTACATMDDGREAVRKAKRDGADFIKVYSLLPRDVFFAIADEAHRAGLPVDGHVPGSVSVTDAAGAGMRCVEHLTGVLTECSSHEAELRKPAAPGVDPSSEEARAARRRANRTAIEHYDATKADAFFGRLVKARVWMCPTLVVLRNIAHLDDPKITTDPRLKYMHPAMQKMWDPANDFRFKSRTAEDAELGKLAYRRQLEVVGAMRKAGVGIVAGTDVLNPYCFPGFSLHDELELLVSAGLTPMEALQAATWNPARMLEREKDHGTVAKGKIADLVLLEANPTVAIGNTRRIEAVIAAGRLTTKDGIAGILDAVEKASKPAP